MQKPPMAKVSPAELEKHGHVRTDPYFWLKDRDNPDVIAYLEAENAYTETMMAHTRDLQEALFEEITGRIVQDDASVPYKQGDYWYYQRYEKGREYAIYCRKKESLQAAEEVMLDVNMLAEGHEFFSVRGTEVSSNQAILAYAQDTVGRRFYTIRFKNLTTGETYPDAIPNVVGNLAWANDNQMLFYTKQDATVLRWHQIYRHILGTDPADDELVYEETDDTFSIFVYKTKSKDFLIIGSTQTLSAEYRYLDANAPTGTFDLIQPREGNHEYSVDHYGNYSNDKEYYDYMLSYSPYDNVEAKDSPNMLVTTGLHDSQVQYWEPAKWVTKLRATKTDANRLMLKTNMEAGHGGATGRFKRHRETALAYAFLLDLAGIHTTQRRTHLKGAFLND